MTRYEISDRDNTITVEAVDETAAILAYAERKGLIAGSDFADAVDLRAINDLEIEAL